MGYNGDRKKEDIGSYGLIDTASSRQAVTDRMVSTHLVEQTNTPIYADNPSLTSRSERSKDPAIPSLRCYRRKIPSQRPIFVVLLPLHNDRPDVLAVCAYKSGRREQTLDCRKMSVKTNEMYEVNVGNREWPLSCVI